MSDTGTTLQHVFGTTDILLPLVLDDIDDAEARRRTRDGGGPSIAWTVGHLLHCRFFVLGMLGSDRSSPFGDTFTREADDGADYPALAEFQRLWGEVAGLLSGALADCTAEGWDAPAPERFFGKSVREAVTFLAWHEGYHMGAIGQMRKGMGLPGPAEKMAEAMKRSEG